ncbi:MAG: hypothetical protein ACRDRS_20425 [Pseudonocardiaceae bacterium]
MRREDRAVLRELSRAVHDTAVDVGTDQAPPSAPEVVGGLAAAWDRYRAGGFAVAGALVAIALRQAAAVMRATPADEQCAAYGVMADAYRLAAYVANQFGARDLAYAAIGHAQTQADLAADPVREAMVASGRSWIYLRDARLDQAAQTAERSYLMIEPRYGDRDLRLLATYGWHVTFAAVVAAREGNVGHADDPAVPGARGGRPHGPGRLHQRHRVRSRDRRGSSCRHQRLDRPARQGDRDVRLHR